MVDRCFVTAGLLDALRELAADREPEAVSTLLATTPAGEFDVALGVGGAIVDEDAIVDDGLAPETPVFTDFYLPSEGRSVDAVFGMDVSVPHAQAQGRFVSHPRGELSVGTRDDLHEVVLVAVPPWGRDDVAAFDRSGTRLALRVVDAAPPERAFDG